jgi:geranylgeranyl pyrophosphate synthase
MRATGTAPFEQVLDAAGGQVRTLLGEVEGLLAAVTGSHGGRLESAAGDTLAAGGKRLRPLLVLICGEPGDSAAARESLLRAAASVELVHMASLVHDDVVDGALVRRGRPTVYAAAGAGAATATGDFLFSRAFSLLERNDDGRQVMALSEACLALARGELLQREDASSMAVGVERYLLRCGLKTASLFAAACTLGSLAGGASERSAEALGRFGRKLGLAFQILDDVLDVAGTAERTGKERGTDLLEGTVTLPLILAAEFNPQLRALDLRAVGSRREAQELCERIADTDALERSRAHADALVEEAKTELGGKVGENVSELLRLVADRVVSRYS